MKIFLGNAPWVKEGFYGVRAGSRWPHFERAEVDYMPFPFFLAYSAAVLEAEGFHEVLIIDGVAERMSDEKFFAKIKEFQPDLALLEVSTISIDVDLAALRKIREIIPVQAKTAFSGLHTFMYEPAFFKENPEIDFVLRGEYEYTLRDLAKALQEGKTDFSEIQGITWRVKGNEVKTNPDRPVIQNLDELPLPARHLLPMQNYCDTPGGIPRPSVQMWASRGCPYNCIFCAWPQIMYHGRSYRTRNPVKVIDEFELLVKEQGFKSVFFDDDTFNIGKERILKMCEEICRRGLEKTPWAIMARADTADAEMLKAMRKAGLHALKYGVENASQEIVSQAGKKLDLKKLTNNVKLTKDLGIYVHLTFMFGLPGETRETIKKTIELACELDPVSLQFSIVTPFPGSKFYTMLDEKGFLISKNFADYDGYNKSVIRTEHLSAKDLEEALCEANQIWCRHKELSWKRYCSFPQRLKRAIKQPMRTAGKIKDRLVGNKPPF